MHGLDRNDITQALRQLGAAENKLLLIHSSLSSFGYVNGGAATVVGALEDLAGDVNSIFVPTFNFGQLAFNPGTTRSLTGAISEAVRGLPIAYRSRHPTHSVAGFGPDAQRILSAHPIMEPFGIDSPIWQLWNEDAQVLLLGCDHRASSVIHVAEMLTHQPYLNRTRIGRVIEAGTERELTVTRPPCSKGFNVVDNPLRTAGKIHEGMIGKAHVMLMHASDVVTAAIELLAKDPAALLCEDPQCAVCLESRKMITSPRADRSSQ